MKKSIDSVAADFEQCRHLYRDGSPLGMVARFLPPGGRDRASAVHAFTRVPDQWVAHHALSVPEKRALLAEWRLMLQASLDGHVPSSAVIRAFAWTARESRMALNEPFLFLDAMESDLTVKRYPTYSSLEHYMRGSASAVGLMYADALGIKRTPAITDGTIALCEAMQLTNFLKDLGRELEHGRIYVPLEDLDRFGVTEEDLYNHRIDHNFMRLMDHQIARARGLYSIADRALPELPWAVRRSVRFVRTVYGRVLDRIAESGYDVFGHPARPSTPERLGLAARLLIGR